MKEKEKKEKKSGFRRGRIEIKGLFKLDIIYIPGGRCR